MNRHFALTLVLLALSGCQGPSESTSTSTSTSSPERVRSPEQAEGSTPAPAQTEDSTPALAQTEESATPPPAQADDVNGALDVLGVSTDFV